MERQRLQGPGRPARQVVRVDPVDAGHPAPGRRLDVEPGRERRREEVGDGRDGVGQPRQPAEQLGQAGVHLGRDPGALAEQRVRGGRHELRVGPQERQEVVERAPEPDLGDHGVHLGADARDLGPPDGVDLLRRHVERRELADAPGIGRGPVGRLSQADGRARARQVLVAHERQERAVARHDGVADGLAPGLRQPCPLRLGHRLGEVGERRPERARLGVLDDVGRDRGRQALDGDGRQRSPRLEPVPHVGDLGVDVLGPGAQPGEVGLDLGDGRGRLLARQARKGDVEPVRRGDRGERRPEALGLDHVVEQGAQDAGGDAPLAVEPGGVDPAEPVQERRRLVGPRHSGRRRHVLQPVVVVSLADVAREQRVVGQPPRPPLADERLERGRLGRRPGRVGRSLRERGDGQQREGENGETAHRREAWCAPNIGASPGAIGPSPGAA